MNMETQLHTGAVDPQQRDIQKNQFPRRKNILST